MLLVAGVVLVAVIGGYLYYAFRSDAPPKEKLESTATAAPLTSADGTWTVIPEAPTVVRYRINEVLTGIHKETAGETAAVDGSITVNGTTVSDAHFEADLRTLHSDDQRRDARIHRDGLQSDTFPTATFQLTKPIDVGSIPAPGTSATVTATGDLTLHGVTKPVEVPLQIAATGGGQPRIEVLGTVPIVLADYGIQPPDIAGFVSVEDHGQLEVHLFLQPAAK